MPRVVSLKSGEEKSEYLRSLFRETYIRDIEERRRVDHPEVLEGIIDLLCSNVGSLTNPRTIASAFRNISEGTVRKYLDYIIDAFLLTEAKRFDVKGKRYFSFPEKFYCEDVGLRNARLNFRQQEVTLNPKNSEGVSVRIPKKIDFVANRFGERVYIQSAFAIPDERR